MRNTAENIKEQFLESGVDIPVEEIEERLDKLTSKFKVPLDEARRSVVSYFLKQYNVNRDDFFASRADSTEVRVADISGDGQWVDLRIKVVRLWDNTNESISQVGLVGDETGNIKFIKWARDVLPDLEEGHCYLLKSVVTSEWNGRYEVTINKNTVVEEIFDDIPASIPDPSESSQVSVADINANNQWVDLRIKVVQLWDNTHESISQVGLIGDETGNIKFVKWARDSIPDLEEGHCYLLKSVVSNEWNGRFGINLNKNTVVEEIFDEIPAIIPEAGGSSPQISIDNINIDGQWVSVKAKVVQLWDTLHESMSQVGLVGDETGTIKFTLWASSGLPDVEEGKVYLFNNVVINQWNDRYSISINKSSSIEELSEDIEVGTATVTFTGALVDIQQGSGLIKRCPTCNRALTKGACMEHGKVDGVHDLRIKAVIDDGRELQEAIIKKDLSESISGISLEEAINMAMDAFDQGVVLDAMKSRLIGKYFSITGTRMDRYMLVDTMEQKFLLDDDVLDELILEAEVV